MCIVIFYIFVLLPSILAGQQEPLFRDDYNYSGKIDGWLKLHRVPDTWQRARLRCHFEGAVLASPLNHYLLAEMMDLVSEAKLDFIFTGIHSIFSVGDYSSVEGVPLYKMSITWMTNEPNNNQDVEPMCLVMSQSGEMADEACSLYLPYVCYKPNSDRDKHLSPICGKEGYEYVPSTNSCYKFHVHGVTWSQGYMACQAEEAYLAIINSENEAQVIRDLLSRHPEGSMQADFTHVTSIGYASTDWGLRGLWWTVHGETLEQAGYATWDSKQRDDGQYCGGVNRNGKLNDIWCNEYTFPFICEKEPLLNHLTYLRRIA